jgi:2-hydroxychromene-2-carboxylate isomerase
VTPFGDAARLSVLLDIRQPHAYLALHPAGELAAEGVAVDWLPIAVTPLKPPPNAGPDDERSLRHRRNRADAVAREIETYAAAQGLVIRDYYRDPDPTPFHVAWLWVRDVRPERLFAFLSEAFRAYWSREFDPSEAAAVEALLKAADLNGAEFAVWRDGDGATALDALATDLAERGLSRSPTYLLEDEVFVGRQHLPMIRWILAGRVGRGPI